MSDRFVVALKFVVFPLCLVPLVTLIYRGLTNNLGPDQVATITHQTGHWTLYFLLLTLAITPVRRLSRHLAWLVRFRRMLGLFAFFYAVLHLTTWVWLFSNFDVHVMTHDVVKRPFITAGFFAWTLLLTLAATSSRWSIRKLGGKRWQALHRVVYIAAIAGVLHYWWIVKPGVHTPWKVTAVLALLLLARLLWPVFSSARKKAVVVTV
jgi:sulfoxide reductase heme-binding subunit YedZ